MANSYSDRRVVVTGMGLVTPLGHDLNTFWQNLITSQCGIDKITAFDATGFDRSRANRYPVRRIDRRPEAGCEAGGLPCR